MGSWRRRGQWSVIYRPHPQEDRVGVTVGFNDALLTTGSGRCVVLLKHQTLLGGRLGWCSGVFHQREGFAPLGCGRAS